MVVKNVLKKRKLFLMNIGTANLVKTGYFLSVFSMVTVLGAPEISVHKAFSCTDFVFNFQLYPPINKFLIQKWAFLPGVWFPESHDTKPETYSRLDSSNLNTYRFRIFRSCIQNAFA